MVGVSVVVLVVGSLVFVKFCLAFILIGDLLFVEVGMDGMLN